MRAARYNRGVTAPAGRAVDLAPVERFFQFSLLGMLASGYCAVVSSGVLDLPTAIAAGLALVLRGLYLSGQLRLRSTPALVNGITIAYLFFYPLDYLLISQNFLAATVHLVFFVAIVKVLTAETPRDFFLLQVIAFLELLAASILSLSLSFFPFLILFLCFSVATFAGSEIRRSAEGKRIVVRGAARFGGRLSWLTVFTTTGILIITSGLFFGLPRTARAALERLVSRDADSPVSGFSSEINLGQIGAPRRTSAIALQVRFDPPASRPLQRWRGATLGEFDGTRWYNSSRAGQTLFTQDGLLHLASDEQRRRIGERQSYEVLLRPIASDTLFTLDTPEFIQIPTAPSVIQMPTDWFRLPFRTGDWLRYRVFSFAEQTAATPGPTRYLSTDQRNFYLRLPPMDFRVREMARRVTAGIANDRDRAAAIERYLRTQFRYSLEPWERETEEPVTYFLFERKKGHCEYFASAMAVMLRQIWIPARVVTGFLAQQPDRMGDWQVVRASDAHSWVEAYVPGAGWVTFDPTPPDPNPQPQTMLGRLQYYMDSAEVFWQDWVLGYDLERQINLAFEVNRSRDRLGFSRFDAVMKSIRDASAAAGAFLSRYGPGFLGVTAFLAAAWFLLPLSARWVTSWKRKRRIQRGEADANDATQLYQEMLSVLATRGLAKPSWVTPSEFAAMLPASQTAQNIRAFTDAYYELRYSRKRGSSAALATLLDAIRQSPVT